MTPSKPIPPEELDRLEKMYSAIAPSTGGRLVAEIRRLLAVQGELVAACDTAIQALQGTGFPSDYREEVIRQLEDAMTKARGEQ